MTEIDKKLLEEACKHVLLDIAVNSTHLKENVTFKQHVGVCNTITEMTYEEAVSYVFNKGEILDEFGIRDFEGKFKKMLKYGMAAIAGGVVAAMGAVSTALVAPAIGVFVYYLFRKVTDPCWQACIKKMPMSTENQICKYQCHVTAAKNIVRDIKVEMNKCSQTKNPPKCTKALQKQYIKWSKKLQSEIINLRQATAKADEKRRKQQEKERKAKR